MVRPAAVAVATCAALCCAAAASAEQWIDRVDRPPFYCRADFSLVPHAALLDELDELHHALSAMLGLPAAQEAIQLYLFRDQASYEQYMNARYPRLPARRALFVKDRGPGMVFAFRSPVFDVDLRHETTHALLHAVLPQVPLWLDEGLAEYFEVAPHKRASGHLHLVEMRDVVRSGYVPRLEALEVLDDVEQMGRREYRDAWAWVHFVIHGPAESRHELTAYVADLRSGRPAGHLSRRLPQRLRDVRGHFIRHFATWPVDPVQPVARRS